MEPEPPTLGGNRKAARASTQASKASKSSSRGASKRSGAPMDSMTKLRHELAAAFDELTRAQNAAVAKVMKAVHDTVQEAGLHSPFVAAGTDVYPKVRVMDQCSVMPVPGDQPGEPPDVDAGAETHHSPIPAHLSLVATGVVPDNVTKSRPPLSQLDNDVEDSDGFSVEGSQSEETGYSRLGRRTRTLIPTTKGIQDAWGTMATLMVERMTFHSVCSKVHPFWEFQAKAQQASDALAGSLQSMTTTVSLTAQQEEMERVRSVVDAHMMRQLSNVNAAGKPRPREHGSATGARHDSIADWCKLELQTRWLKFRASDKVLHPSGATRTSWDLFGVVVVMWDVLTLPLQAFKMPEDFDRIGHVITFVSGGYWTVDIAVGFLTATISDIGEIETKHIQIARQYLKSWFWLDLVVACNDWIIIVTEGQQGTMGFVRLAKVAMRFTRLLRLVRLVKISRNLTESMNCVHHEGMRTLIHVVKYFTYLTLVSHYVACIWFAMSTSIGYPGWAEDVTGDTSQYQYLTSLHWAMTQFTPSSMEVQPKNWQERLFACLVIASGLLLFSSFVSGIQQAMTHLRQIREKEEEKERQLRKFFHDNKISYSTSATVWKYLTRNRVFRPKKTSAKDVAIFPALPVSMRISLLSEAYSPLLSQHPLFDLLGFVEPACVRKICTQAVCSIFLQTSDELFSAAIPITAMVFVQHGTLIYTHQHDDIDVIKVTPGMWCCEEILWGSPQKCALGGILGANHNHPVDVMLVEADTFRAIAKMHDSTGLLKRYAAAFVQAFNEACVAENCTDLLFSNHQVLEMLVSDVVHEHYMNKHKQSFPKSLAEIIQSRRHHLATNSMVCQNSTIT
eukprot:TRINITY_DN44309_c0_g1_i1.p1 TRINITY_DN44309_c0_g1~~TRINITY_DN44309_c0_g1_i1.p1  ORF type:complete len:846 (+),score=164.42 TRINITY_DN44309_c0_g1_i1:150-2687(+)